MSSESGISDNISFIGLSINASITENNPIMKRSEERFSNPIFGAINSIITAILGLLQF